MAEDGDEAEGAAQGAEGAKGGRRRSLMLGAALMALCGAGAFAAVSMGLVPGLGGAGAEAAEGQAEPEAHAAEGAGEAEGGHGGTAGGVPAFVPVEPLTVTLGAGAVRTHLRFTVQLEVPADRVAGVTALMPRVVDVLGGYLRALDPATIEDSDAHVRLRAQMLRRVRLVLGAEAVDDLLVMEFVVN